MSDTLVDVINKIDKAHEKVSNLCKSKYVEGHIDWIMTIPARPDYDPDLVIGDALFSAKRLLLNYAGTLLGKKKIAVNGNLIHIWQDEETKMWIAEFINMLSSGETEEQAISGLQKVVLLQAKVFAGELTYA